MKTFLLVCLLSSSAFAAVDVCYLFPRGSEEWVKCKEQLIESTAREDRQERASYQASLEFEAQRATTAQNEVNRLLQAQQNKYQEGK